MQFGIKHRVLLLALVPTITISVLLGTYFVNTRLQDLEEAFCAHREKIALQLEKELSKTSPDLSQIENLRGWLKLELETKSMQLHEYQILAKAILISLLSLSISALLAYRMGRNLTHPILEIGKVVNKIREGALNTRTQVSSYAELKMLGAGINTMAETLENAHNELQHKINQATLSLRRTLETIEVQNIELEMSRRAAEHANKIKSEFLADMSHEIRTPLNAVIGFVNLLQKTELNQKQQEYIRTIQKSANNLLTILNDILDFSKMEAGKLRIERSIMDIRECIEEILNLLLPYAQEKNIALIPLIYSDVPTHVLSDPLRIKQIVTNLVNNAIKFTERGSVIVRVMLEKESFSHTTIRVQVADTGIGLSPEEQKVLFHAFNQTKIGATHKLGGTGLGLVICKKLVEQMGGIIGVESEPQKGSTFWFTFQVEFPPQIESTLEASPSLTSTPALSSFVPYLDVLQSPTTVLAVDDNPENLKLIRILLEDMGIEVTTRNNGKAAIAAVRQKTFHLILLDIRMPNMNGVEAAHIIRNVEAEFHRNPTPIIALTANALTSDKKALFENGINDYLTKPIGEIELKNILEKWIEPRPNSCTIDWALGKKLAGGKAELAQEFFEKLRKILPLEKRRINEDYQKRNWTALGDRVHKLHGVCCYCGVPKLKNCVQTLETAAASCVSDIIKPHLEAFNLAVDAVLTEAENTTVNNI
ncbi:MAG TPA: ATP-binding protein [Gammaproteobacteria bacterium]|nr:ATP-binding protein [Gammaproteobacteria bacterium]